MMKMILTEKLMTFFILSDFNKNNFKKGDKNERKSKRIAKKAF